MSFKTCTTSFLYKRIGHTFQGNGTDKHFLRLKIQPHRLTLHWRGRL